MKLNKFEIFFYFLIVGLLLLLVASARGQENQASDLQLSGGTFTITKTVVAGGGQTMQNAPMNASATAGQTVAGKTSTGGQFSLYSGFWTPDDFTPTGATVNVGGRVTAANGRGIRNAVIRVTFPSGETRSTRSGEGGRFNFGDIEAGANYLFSVISKRVVFSNPTQILTINEERDDVNFVSDN